MARVGISNSDGKEDSWQFIAPPIFQQVQRFGSMSSVKEARRIQAPQEIRHAIIPPATSGFVNCGTL